MNIIFLNGTSSSGKTSLARELQNQFAENYLYFGFDVCLDMMPSKANSLDNVSISDGYSWEDVILPNKSIGKRIVVGEYGKRIEESYRNMVKTLLESGNNLIADSVISKIEIDSWRNWLSDFNGCFVGVQCELELLIEREKSRGDRIIGAAAEQYFRIHKGIKYDLSVDTGSESIEVCAEQIVNYIADNSSDIV